MVIVIVVVVVVVERDNKTDFARSSPDCAVIVLAGIFLFFALPGFIDLELRYRSVRRKLITRPCWPHPGLY